MGSTFVAVLGSSASIERSLQSKLQVKLVLELQNCLDIHRTLQIRLRDPLEGRDFLLLSAIVV